METRSQSQQPACKGLGRNGQSRPSRPRPLTLRLLTAPARALLKRARQPRNLHIRTLGTMVKAQPSHPRPLMLRFLIGLARALIFYF
ncbi:hypothetical protein B4586_01310 [Lacticaseibacillus paracasei]|nr:hypothetical protein B4586_01310 [Lacticaseibacillus paracasei]